MEYYFMSDNKQKLTPKKYIIDYSEKFKNKELITLIGREKETSRIIQTLIRSTKNSPLLIGDSGVGKRALIQGVAAILSQPHNYPALSGKKLFSINTSLMLTDSADINDYTNIFKNVINSLIQQNNAILYISDSSTLVKMKGYEENSAIANFMKVKFTDREIQCILATDTMNFKNYLEPDTQIMSNVQILHIEEPNIRESYDILLGSKKVYEKHYNISIKDEILKTIVNLGFRYIKNRRFPDKAFDILDDACALVQLRGSKELTNEDIGDVVSSWTGIPLEKLDTEEKQRLVNMEELLRSRVKGQEEAVNLVSDGMRRAKSGLQDPNRPIASFLFIGTTGVGKTELAKALAEFIFSDETALLRLDMSEFMERSNITRLLGPPPGTPGYEQGGMLTESVRLRPYQVVLFDELEKAHPDVLNILLQLLDEGRLTDSRGVTVDFRNTIVIMTSNIGSNVPRYQRMEVLGRALRAEFLNRIDDIVTFAQLGEEDLLGVVGIQLRKLLNRAKEQKIDLEFSVRLRKWLVAEVYASKYGVRALKRLIQHEIENKLAWLLLNERIKAGDKPIVDMDSAERNIIITLNEQELLLDLPNYEDTIREQEANLNKRKEDEEEKSKNPPYSSPVSSSAENIETKQPLSSELSRRENEVQIEENSISSRESSTTLFSSPSQPQTEFQTQYQKIKNAPLEARTRVLPNDTQTQVQVQPSQTRIEPTQPQAQPSQTRTELTQSQVQPAQTRIEPTQPQAQPSQTRTELKQSQVQPAQTRTELTQSQVQPAQTQTEPKQPQAQPSQTRTEPKQPQVQPSQTRTEPAPPPSRPQNIHQTQSLDSLKYNTSTISSNQNNELEENKEIINKGSQNIVKAPSPNMLIRK